MRLDRPRLRRCGHRSLGEAGIGSFLGAGRTRPDYLQFDVLVAGCSLKPLRLLLGVRERVTGG